MNKFRMSSTGELQEILSRARSLIDKSTHYRGNIDTIEFMRDKLTDDQFTGYLIGNIYKYLSRYDKKGNAYENLNKGFIYYIWLLNTMISLESAKGDYNV